MSAAKELRQRIEGCELQHPSFVELFDALEQRIVDARSGFAARIEWVLGPSRVGKTMLINALARCHPEEKIQGKRHVPVLVVPIPPNISPKLLPISVLLALGVPLPQRGITTGVMFNRMLDQLRLAQTRVLIFEEASHLVEPGARVPPRAAGDWFKSVADILNMTLILFGVPRLERLFDSNEQFRLRASSRREFRPYDLRQEAEQRAFATCVHTYAELFRRSGWPIELPLPNLVAQCGLLSGGLIGVVSRFMQEMASQLAKAGPRTLSWTDCQRVARAVESAGHPDFPAFHAEAVSMIALHQAHTHVLETNGLPVRRVERINGGT